MRSATATRRQITAEWASIVHRSGASLEALGLLPLTPKLLGSSTKVELGEGIGVITKVVYLAPAGEAMKEGDRRTLCGDSTAKCRELCLGHSSGLLAKEPARKARLWKTALLLGARGLFRELLDAESHSFMKATPAAKVAAVRVDGSSDTGEGRRLAKRLPTLQCYDYTKNEGRAVRNATGGDPVNYHLTFSYSGRNTSESLRVLQSGGNVAVVFDAATKTTSKAAEALPRMFLGSAVIDGDAHDARFTETERGVVIGLRFKAAEDKPGALAKAGEFVVRMADIFEIAA